MFFGRKKCFFLRERVTKQNEPLEREGENTRMNLLGFEKKTKVNILSGARNSCHGVAAQLVATRTKTRPATREDHDETHHSQFGFFR